MTERLYVFQEEWEIPARIEDVWDVLANGRLLPQWWRGVYLAADPMDEYEEPVVGARIRATARGYLPYRLRFIIQAMELQRPTLVAVKVRGDLTGTWRAELEERDGVTRVRFEERVTAEKPILKFFTPILKPLFAWNHYWTTPRAVSGMRAYLAEQGKLVDGVERVESAR